MSFFEVMKRMAQGKPAFEDEEKRTGDDKPAQPAESANPDPNRPTIRKGDGNSFPVVYIKRTRTNMNGNKMEVYCQIVNTWPEEVMIDKIRILDTTNELDDFIDGNREEEFLVYSGPRLSRQISEAQLDYKTQREGDYFRAVHDVTFKYHDEDKTYSVSDVRLRRPIQDIYG